MALINIGSAIIMYYCIVFVAVAGNVAGCYKAIISFGDSLADTGNLIHISQYSNDYVKSSVPPYGETFFHHPTGRFSDGRLIIDFMASSMGLPFVRPYIGGKSNDGKRSFAKGVNFAVAGATAMDISFFNERGIINDCTNTSFGTQLDWFKQMFSSFCHSPADCKEDLANSIVLMGEIGGNDYNYAFLQGRPKEEVLSYVPKVIAIITSAINELIEYGAETIVVPGNLPIGCSAAYLTTFTSPNASEYDPKNGCLNWYNKFSQYHNELLLSELDRLKQLHPHVTIIYADYYNAAMRIYNSPSDYGFNNTRTACCGGGGPYNYNPLAFCGTPLSTACDNPSSYVSWDGVHLTEAAYRWVADGLLQGPFTTPQINGQCNLSGPKPKYSDA